MTKVKVLKSGGEETSLKEGQLYELSTNQVYVKSEGSDAWLFNGNSAQFKLVEDEAPRKEVIELSNIKVINEGLEKRIKDLLSQNHSLVDRTNIIEQELLDLKEQTKIEQKKKTVQSVLTELKELIG